MFTTISPISVRGAVQAHYVYPWGHVEATPAIRNTILYDWGPIVALSLRNIEDGKSYHIGGMYIEFDNSGAVVDPLPTIARDGAGAYYSGLNLSDPNRDFLRVGLTATSGSKSHSTNFSADNIATFIAQTEGSAGFHGNTFSDIANSKVYGGALVAFRDFADQAQDLVFSRFYFPTANQLDKPAGAQISLTWPITFN